MKNLSVPTNRRGGFSLVELLVVIAVIGVIAAIAIPQLSNIGSSAKTAVNQRNAQSIVSTYLNGAAAGATWSGTSRNTKIQAVIAGTSPTDGVFQGKTFQLPNVSAADQQAAYPYIGYDTNGDLFYDKTGGQPTS